MRSFQKVASLVGFTTLLAGVLSAHAAAADEDVIAGVGSTLDYPAFRSCLSGPAAPVAAGCSTSNFHPDGHIDLRDFAVLQRSYQTLSPSVIQPGAETVGQIAPIDDVDVFTFFAPQGATVTVDFSTPTVNNRPDLTSRINLLRPNGTEAATVPSCDFTARLDTVSVDATGTWSVRVRAYEQWLNCGYGADDALRTGLYTLTVCLSNTPATPISYGQTIASSFAVDCQIVNFSFAGSMGDVVSAMYVGPTSTRRIRIFSPTGTELAASGAGPGVGIFDLALPSNGTYRLSAEASDNVAVGTFSIGLTELTDAVPIAFNTPVNTTIGQVAEVDLYSFNATAPSFVTVDYSTPTVNNRPDHPVRLDLVRPDGTTAATVPSCDFTTRLDNVAVNQTGTWTVRVRSYEQWLNCGYGPDTGLLTGAYRLTVCGSTTCPP